MKLRIKETGEILEDVKFIDTTLHKITIQYLDNGVLRECSVENLLDIEEVKDYKVPKGYYFIRSESLTVGYSPISNTRSCRNRKEIGNYFETKEEAEEAIEKLKAWKRLKDKGFRFIGARKIGKVIDFDIPMKYYRDCLSKFNEDGLKLIDDLNLLFGGEE